MSVGVLSSLITILILKLPRNQSCSATSCVQLFSKFLKENYNLLMKSAESSFIMIFYLKVTLNFNRPLGMINCLNKVLRRIIELKSEPPSIKEMFSQILNILVQSTHYSQSNYFCQSMANLKDTLFQIYILSGL